MHDCIGKTLNAGVTIPKSFNVSLQKGGIGEQIICSYLHSRGWITYRPTELNKAHFVDIIATKGKEKVIAVEVKTKARLNKWAAQGINIKAYKEYLNFIDCSCMPLYLFFIDDKCGDVYWQDLLKLSEGFNPAPNIIAWNLSEMNYLFTLDSYTIKMLSQYDQRNYDYSPK